MDKELREFLTAMNQDMQNMKSDMHSMKSEMNSMKSDMHSMKSETNSMKSDVHSMKSEMNSMKSDVHSMKSEMNSMKSEMHWRFDTVDAKLDGIGNQFELTNETIVHDRDVVVGKINNMEQDIYHLKNNTND